MISVSLLLLLTAATPCAGDGVSLRESGPGPDPKARAAIERQLTVEFANQGYRRCDGEAANRVSWQWLSPTRVTVEVVTPAGVRSKTIERDASAMPLALPVFTGELLREARLPPVEDVEVPVVAAPAPPKVVAPASFAVLAQLEGSLPSAGALLAGGSIGAWWPLGPVWLEAGAGALGSPVVQSPSGRVRAWGFLGRLGGGVKLLGSPSVSLHLAAHAVLVVLKVDGLSSGAAQGLSSWTPGLTLRGGPQVRFTLGPVQLFLGTGVGGWLSGLSIFDGATEVSGARGVEWWAQLGTAVSWN